MDYGIPSIEQYERSPANKTQKIVILISGRGSNMVNLAQYVAALPPLTPPPEALPLAVVAAVIADRPEASGLLAAQELHVPTVIVNFKIYEKREDFEVELARSINQFQPDWVLLAGFMRVLGQGFVNQFSGRLINIHPSLLPKFPGLRTHRQALVAGELEHGATVHFVTAQLDHGPVIEQCKVPILLDDTEETLANRVLQAEHQLYPRAVMALLSGKFSSVAAQLIASKGNV
jgi:phosphoribosylglycinamide formyltransferase 1